MVKRTFNSVRATVMCRCSIDAILSQQSGCTMAWSFHGLWQRIPCIAFHSPAVFLGLLYGCGLYGWHTTIHLTAVTLIHTAISFTRAALYEYHSLRFVRLTNGFPPSVPPVFPCMMVPGSFSRFVAGLDLRCWRWFSRILLLTRVKGETEATRQHGPHLHEWGEEEKRKKKKNSTFHSISGPIC